MTQQQAYYQWCSRQVGLPLFMQGWWLDAVCVGKEWTVQSLPSGAMMPFLLRKRLGMRYILMPQETQIGGYFGSADSADAIDASIRALKPAYYYQKYPIGSPIPLELQKKGYTVNQMTTYRIEDLSDLEAVRKRYSENKRRQLKKASSLDADESLTANEFYSFHERCLKAQGKVISYSETFFLSLYNACREHQAGHIICLRTGNGDLAAAVFLVYDESTTYYLIPTYDPQLGNSGAGARLVDEAISFAAHHSRVFDFEGSMIPGVAEHYRQFGSVPTTYYAVERTFNPLFRILLRANEIRSRKQK